jgi:hypothetical protein
VGDAGCAINLAHGVLPCGDRLHSKFDDRAHFQAFFRAPLRIMLEKTVVASAPRRAARAWCHGGEHRILSLSRIQGTSE